MKQGFDLKRLLWMVNLDWMIWMAKSPQLLYILRECDIPIDD